MNRLLDEVGGVIIDDPFHIFREVLGESFHCLLDRLFDLEPIGVAQLVDTNGGSRLAVEPRIPAILFGT